MSLKDFSASEDEMNLANQILFLSDCEEGPLQSDAAISIFERSGLSHPILRDIWNLVDENATGELLIHELAAAIRLMGWVQAGKAPGESLLIKSGPLPILEGVTYSPPIRFPPLNQDDIRHFKRTFNMAGPLGGFLDGDIVLDIYLKSNLSYGELWKIRKLVDVTERGALDFREFAMGMYLIQAIQSCFIASLPSVVPPELQELFSDPALFDLHLPSRRLSHSLQAKVSAMQSSSQSRILLVPGTSIPTPGTIPLVDSWDVSPTERFEANKHFQKLDLDRKGYLEGKTVTNFMSTYNLVSEDLARIWNLADLNGNKCLTKDEFAVIVYLINRKIAGDEIPASLPPSLVPPSMRSKGRHSLPPGLSPKQLAKFKSPPPPPPKRESSRTKRPHSGSTVSNNSDHLKLPTPPLPPSPIKSPKVQSPPSLSPPELFEDPMNGTSSSRHSPIPACKPRPPEHSNNEALEEFKKETSRLTSQVDSLLSQVTAQNHLQDANETLRREKDLLKAQMRDMERTVSEVLSANDQNGSEEQYNQEIARLSTELASKEVENESAQRMLAVLTEEDTDLRRHLRELQTAITKAKTEVEDLRQNVASRDGVITELRAQLSDMGKAMAEGPASTSSNRELQVFSRDVARENDRLRSEVRDMQKSMEQLLLSTRSHAKFDEVERENRRLQVHVQELEMLATRLQPSNNLTQGRLQVSDEVARENEQLNNQLQIGHRAYAALRSCSETTIGELQRKLATLEHENNQLKLVANSNQGQEDNTIPPPAYNDSFVIPE